LRREKSPVAAIKKSPGLKGQSVVLDPAEEGGFVVTFPDVPEGVRKSELARRLGWHMPQVDRVLNMQHATRLDQAEAALAALGRSLSVQVEVRA
jgi:antitoxin HicB